MPKKPKPPQLTSNPISVRVPPALRERIDALAPYVGTQAAAIRIALLEGVRVLERRYKDS